MNIEISESTLDIGEKINAMLDSGEINQDELELMKTQFFFQAWAGVICERSRIRFAAASAEVYRQVEAIR